MSPSHLFRLISEWLPTTLVLLLSPVAQAQVTGFEDEEIVMPGLDVESSAGLEGTADTSMAVPISLLFNNVSRTPVEGWLVLSDPWGNRERVLEEIYLAEGQKRRFGTIQDLTGWSRCVISIRKSNGEIIFRRDLPVSNGSGFLRTHSTALIINDSNVKLACYNNGVEVDSNLANIQTRFRNGRSDWTPAVLGQNGRPIQSVNVKTWQIPGHPAPMQKATAIVFAEGLETFRINKGQWTAIARYICEGGCVFVSAKSQKVLEELLSKSPLLPDPTIRRSPFDVREMGLGLIYICPGPLFTDDAETDRAVGEEISRLVEEHPANLLQLGHSYNRESGRSEMNRVLIGSFFGLYALLSGLGSLVLFRRSRKQITAYIATVVCAGCLIAVALGGTMRLSRGDVHWVSVMEGGAGGVVEYAKFEVQSAGNRNSQLQVSAPNPDLQVAGRPRRYYYYQSTRAFPPFTWQRNQSKHEEATYKVDFSITPWGVRNLQAVSYNPNLRRADVALNRNGNAWKFQCTNQLPFTLSDCWLYLSVIDERGNIWRTSQSLKDLNSKDRRELTFKQPARHKYKDDFQLHTKGGSLHPNRSQVRGTTRAWIAAKISKPEQMQISGDSDFVSTASAHFYLQDLQPEEIELR